MNTPQKAHNLDYSTCPTTTRTAFRFAMASVVLSVLACPLVLPFILIEVFDLPRRAGKGYGQAWRDFINFGCAAVALTIAIAALVVSLKVKDRSCLTVVLIALSVLLSSSWLMVIWLLRSSPIVLGPGD